MKVSFHPRTVLAALRSLRALTPPAMCNARPLAGGRMIEPLEPRRLLAATPFNPLELPGAYERPDGSIVIPNSSLADAPAASSTAPADDTAGFFSTTPGPRAKTQAVFWNAQPHASPSGTTQAASASPPYGGYLFVSVSDQGPLLDDPTIAYRPAYETPPGLPTSCGGVSPGYLFFAYDSYCNPGQVTPATSVTISYELGGSATADEDYNGPLLDGSVQVGKHEVVALPFYPKKDNEVEGNETVRATITGVTPSEPGTYQTFWLGNWGETSLVDDPPVVTVDSAADPVAAEPHQDSSGTIINNGIFTIRRSGGDLSQSLPITYAMSGDADGYTIEGPTSFAPNQTAVQNLFEPTQDNTPEPEQSATMTIIDTLNHKAGKPKSATIAQTGAGDLVVTPPNVSVTLPTNPNGTRGTGTTPLITAQVDGRGAGGLTITSVQEVLPGTPPRRVALPPGVSVTIVGRAEGGLSTTCRISLSGGAAPAPGAPPRIIEVTMQAAGSTDKEIVTITVN